MEAALEEVHVALGVGIPHALHIVDAPHGPGVDRRIQIGELPFVGGDLPIGVLELLEEEHPELVLGVVRVDQAEGHAVERQVPGGEPGVFPSVRERHDAHRVEVLPVLVADLVARLGRWEGRVIAVQPQGHVEDVVLLGPEQPGERLALHPFLLLRGLGRVDAGVELVGLGAALFDEGVHPGERVG